MNYKPIYMLAIIIASIVGYPLSMMENVSVSLAQEEDRDIEDEEQQREDNEKGSQETSGNNEEEEGETEEENEENQVTSNEEERNSATEEEEEIEEAEIETEDSKQRAAISSEEEEEPAAVESTDQSRLADASAGSDEPGYIGTEGQIGDFIDSVRSSPGDEQSADDAEQDLTESLEIAAAERTAQATTEEGVTLAEAITEIYNRARGELLKITGKLADAGKINVPPSLQRAFTFVRETNPIISRISSSQKIVDVADALNEARAELERLSVPVLPVPPSTTCPPGQTGTPPNCTPSTPPPTTCPPGQTGTPPNCAPAEQPPVGSTAGTFRDPNNPEEGCSTLLNTERGAQLYDHCLRDDVSRCSLVDPSDNSACDTFIIHPHRNAATDPELAGGNEYSVACIPGYEPVIIGYETEFVTEPVPIVDCQSVS